jgi:hypothetical protein
MPKYYQSRKQDSKTDLEAISRLCYQVSRPLEIVDPNDGTYFSFSLLKHPVNDDYAVAISGDVPTHQLSKDGANGLIDFHLKASEFGDTANLQRIKDLIINNSRVNAEEIVPNRWVERTEQYMVDNGWFDSGV